MHFAQSVTPCFVQVSKAKNKELKNMGQTDSQFKAIKEQGFSSALSYYLRLHAVIIRAPERTRLLAPFPYFGTTVNATFNWDYIQNFAASPH